MDSLKKPVNDASDKMSSSILTEDDNENGVDLLGVDLLYQMDIEDITALRKHFFPKSAGETWLKSNPEGLSLSKSEFIQAMDSIAGSSILSLCAAKLFDALDIDDSGLLQWEEVLDAIIEKTGANRIENARQCIPIDEENISIYSLPHIRGEVIVKVIPLETETTFCYAIVSKLGRVGVYDGELNLLDNYKIGLKADEEAANSGTMMDARRGRRSISTYLTDAIFIADTYALLFACSDRSLHLYDATGLVHVPLCHIIGMPNVPTCLEYHPTMNGKPGLLFLGDDSGNITMIKFHQAKNTLFKKKHPDKLDNFYWTELGDQSKYVTLHTFMKVHNDAVRQISFCADNDTILSCSNDPVRTLVVRHILGRREPYLFKLPRGIRCFHLDRSLHVIATGSNDKVVRLWNSYSLAQPIQCLYGHQSAIVDVRIIRNIGCVLSLEANGILRAWDIKEEVCLTNVNLNFPAFQVPGKTVEYGASSIYPGPVKNQGAQPENRSVKSSDKDSNPGNKGSFSGSNWDDEKTEISPIERVSINKEWQRDSLVIACCDQVAVVQLKSEVIASERNMNGMSELLPPPTNEHYASAPSPWKSAETTHTPRSSIGSKSTRSTESSSTSLPLKGKEAVAGAAPVKDIHIRRTQHRIKQQQMHMLVEQGAPHLALDLHPLQNIKFSTHLPVTTRMREIGVDVSDPDRLLKIRLHRDSTRSLSALPRAQSGTSSVLSTKSGKNAPRKTTSSGKGITTPDWFSVKISHVDNIIQQQ